MLAAAALCLFVQTPVFAPPPSLQDDDRERLQLRSGNVLRGRLVERRKDGAYVFLERGQRRVISPEEVVGKVRTLRDELQEWMEKRTPGLSVAAEWDLAIEAQVRGLLGIARVQAYHVLTRDPGHAGAHRALGHEYDDRSGEWTWELDGRRYSREKFLEAIREWKTGFYLESENYVVQSDAGLRATIDTVIDLERLYLAFMRDYGPTLRATETVLEFHQKMGCALFQSRDDKAIRKELGRTDIGFPCYHPQPETSVVDKYANAIFVHMDPESYRAVGLVDQGTQQLLYTQLVYGRQKGGNTRGPVGDGESGDPTEVPDSGIEGGPQDGGAPEGGQGEDAGAGPEEDEDPLDVPPAFDGKDLVRFAHWAELGFGAFLLDRSRGKPGYLVLVPEANAFPSPDPLRSAIYKLFNARDEVEHRYVRAQLATMLGLPEQEFYSSRTGPFDAPQVQQGRAKGIVFFFMTEPVGYAVQARDTPGRTLPLRAGFLEYLRVVFSEAYAHSTEALDDALQGKVEWVLDPWARWMRDAVR